MAKITKVIMIKNAVETLGYFSEQIAIELEHMGYDIYFIDYNELYQSLTDLSKFAVKGQTALLTFNFIGLGEEKIFRDELGELIWKRYEMKFINILVDHPLYYHTKLMSILPHMTIFCIDREHVKYIRRFYPNLQVKFLPLAGNVRLGRTLYQAGVHTGADIEEREYETIWNYEQELIPYEKRRYDLIFTANYVPPELPERRFLEADREYKLFYRGIADDLLKNPLQSVDAVMERHIHEEVGEVSEVDLCAAIAGMFFIDLWVRTYFRGEIIKDLAEQDIKVHVFGAGWEHLVCKKPQNIIQNSGQVSSAVCVDAVRNAKISLNIMPWFKDGAHDRIFTAMLQQTISLTDRSRYLCEEFENGKELVYFSLEEREKLPDLIRQLLHDENNAMRIATDGYKQITCRHTWRSRVKSIVDEL